MHTIGNETITFASTHQELNLTGSADGTTVIDGTEDITSYLSWVDCALVPAYSQQCATALQNETASTTSAGATSAAKIYTTLVPKYNPIFQLFVETANGLRENFLGREMMVPARWPDAVPFSEYTKNKNKDLILDESKVNATDVPNWVSLFDTRQTWAKIVKGFHGRVNADPSTVASPYVRGVNGYEPPNTGYGWIQDDSTTGIASQRTYAVDPLVQSTTTTSNSYYSVEPYPAKNLQQQTSLNATGATISVSWGFGMTEQGYVYNHTSDMLHFHKIRCHQHGGGSSAPPYQKAASGLSCSDDPFLSVVNNVTNEETGLASYYLSNKLDFLNKEMEWFFDYFLDTDPQYDSEDTNTYSGRLFVRMENDNDPSNYKFHSRSTEIGVKFDCSGRTNGLQNMGKFTLSGITFFANAVVAEKCENWRVLNNDFLYSLTSKKALKHELPNTVDLNYPNLDHPYGNKFYMADYGLLSGNRFKYSEGKALHWQGDEITWEHNEFSFNGFQSLDGSVVIKPQGNSGDYDTRPPAKLHFNTFRYNGQINAIFARKPNTEVFSNFVLFQNFGNLQTDDGVFTSGPTGTSMSKIKDNWVLNSGYFTDSYRFDATESETLASISTNGTLSHNVACNTCLSSAAASTMKNPFSSPKVVAIGQDHTISFNTLVDGEVDIYRNLGTAGQLCGMNENTTIANNLIMKLTAKNDNCVSPLTGLTVTGLPASVSSNALFTSSGTDLFSACSFFLRDCVNKDFRPRATQNANLLATQYGAYAQTLNGLALSATGSGAFDFYNIPGRREANQPTPFAVSYGDFTNKLDASILFLEQRDAFSGLLSQDGVFSATGCTHNVTLGYRMASDNTVYPIAEVEVPAGKNVFHVDAYLKGWTMYAYSIVSNCDTSNKLYVPALLDFEGGTGPLTGFQPAAWSSLYYATTSSTTTTTSTTTQPISVANLYNTDPGGGAAGTSGGGAGSTSTGGATAGGSSSATSGGGTGTSTAATTTLVPAKAYSVASSVTFSFGSVQADSAFWQQCGTTNNLNDASNPLCLAFVNVVKQQVCDSTNNVLPSGKKVDCVYFHFIRIALQVVETGGTTASPLLRRKLLVTVELDKELFDEQHQNFYPKIIEEVGDEMLAGASSSAGRKSSSAQAPSLQDHPSLLFWAETRTSVVEVLLSKTGLLDWLSSMLFGASRTTTPDELQLADHDSFPRHLTSASATTQVTSGDVQVIVEYEIRFPSPDDALQPTAAQELVQLLQAALAPTAGQGVVYGTSGSSATTASSTASGSGVAVPGGLSFGGGSSGTGAAGTSAAGGTSSSSGSTSSTASGAGTGSSTTTSSSGATGGATTSATSSSSQPSFAFLLATAIATAIQQDPLLQTANVTSWNATANAPNAIGLLSPTVSTRETDVWIPLSVFNSVENATAGVDTRLRGSEKEKGRVTLGAGWIVFIVFFSIPFCLCASLYCWNGICDNETPQALEARAVVVEKVKKLKTKIAGGNTKGNDDETTEERNNYMDQQGIDLVKMEEGKMGEEEGAEQGQAAAVVDEGDLSLQLAEEVPKPLPESTSTAGLPVLSPSSKLKKPGGGKKSKAGGGAGIDLPLSDESGSPKSGGSVLLAAPQTIEETLEAPSPRATKISKPGSRAASPRPSLAEEK